MSEFRLERQLPSTVVTKDLIKSIELYLHQRAPGFMKNTDDPEKLSIHQEINIADALGTETLRSIDEYAPIKFPDTTTSIEFKFYGPNYPSLEDLNVTIKFSKDRDSSLMRISYGGPNARESVIGIAEGIIRCMTPYRTMNSWLHPKTFVGMILFVLTFVLLYLLIVAISKGLNIFATGGILLLSFTLIILFYHASKYIRPFSTFDSNRSDLLNRARIFFVTGLLGLIIFNIVILRFFNYISHILFKGK